MAIGSTLQASLTGLPASSSTILIAGWAFLPDFLGTGGNGGINLLTNLGSSGIILNHYDIGNLSIPFRGWKMVGYDTGGSVIFFGSIASASMFSPPSGWVSYAASIDTSTHTLQFLENEVLLSPSITWNSSSPIGLNSGETWQIGPSFYGSETPSSPPSGFPLNTFNWNNYDFYFSPTASFFDLSVAGNVNKLFAPGNHPVPWTPNGSNITGTQPAVFLHGATEAAYIANLGSGGAFTRSGLPLIPNATGPV